MAKPLDITTFDRPYDNFLNRSIDDSSGVPVEGTSGTPTTSGIVSSSGGSSSSSTVGSNNTTGNGSVETMPVKTSNSLNDLWITTYIKSDNWQSKSRGFWIDGLTGYAEFVNVYVSGNIEALTGHIGGFTIGATDLSATSGGNTTILSSGSTAFSAGPTGFPTVTISQAGVLTASGAIISGTITAVLGFIGGWTIGANSLTDTTGFTGMSSLVSGVGDVRFWAGSATPGSAPFYVTKEGYLHAESGTVGGTVLGPTSISSTVFASGLLGKGWRIESTGVAEFQDVTIRGTIRSSVFEKGEISAVNGIVLISKADVLNADMTALDASTVTIKGSTTFVNDEVIRIKDGTSDEYMLVTNAAGAPTYVVTRDLAGTYAPDTNPIWTKGTAVVSMGVGTGTKTGYVVIDATSSNSPFIDVYGRNSNTYTDVTLHGRFGWLKGIVDANVGLNSTDVWGLYSDNVYLTGAINATTGKIGGLTNYWSIGAGSIQGVGSGTVEIKSGQTAYNTGSGFWIGRVSSVSKFSLGNVSTNKYISWDGTNLTIKGGLSVSNLDIPDTTTANSFHTDVNGNSWWGSNVSVGQAGAKAKILNTGVATFKAINIGGDTTQYAVGNGGMNSFGDGSDGSYTWVGTEPPLTRDYYFIDLTIPAGTTVYPNGYRIFVNGTLTINGKIIRSGNNGGAATGYGTSYVGVGALGLPDGYLKGSSRGSNGSDASCSYYVMSGTGGRQSIQMNPSGGYGSPGIPTVNSIGYNGVSGGNGGIGGNSGIYNPNYLGNSVSGVFGPGGGGGTVTVANCRLSANWHLQTMLDITNGGTYKYSGSAGCGGGGGGEGGMAGGGLMGGSSGIGGCGGGSGSAGGMIVIYARNIVINTITGGIEAKGGNGGAGYVGGAGGYGNGYYGGPGGGGGGGGGGGAGGNGGEIVIVYNIFKDQNGVTITGSSGILTTGGTGGAGGAGGAAGIGTGGPGSGGVVYANGYVGYAGATGSTGATGPIKYFQLSL